MTACGAVAAALLTTSGCGLFGSSGSKTSSDAKGAGPGAAASSSPQATPQSVAQAFLTAWGKGDYAGAAALTDDAKDAQARLTAVMTSLAPKTMTLTLGSQENVTSATSSAPAGTSAGGTSTTPAAPASSSAAPALARYDFSVSDDFGNNLVWTYKSGMNLVAGPGGTPLVQFASSVIHPQLGPVALLKAVPPPQTVLDASGKTLDTSKHPTLAGIAHTLSTHVPANATPTQLTVEFVDPKSGVQLSKSNAWPLGPDTGTTASVKTTINPDVQSAIEDALKSHPESGMVAIQPSTGDILGMASNAPDFAALEYQSTRAPGSTFKVITTALALQEGLKTSDPVKCTASATVEGKPIHNDESLSNGIAGGGDLKDAFEQSCNTAFVNLAMDGKLGSDYTVLANEAKTYFGMNQKWDLGMGQATYGTSGDQQVPPADGKGLFARDAFGQGTIEMSPLTMASVAATVCNGSFKQPILVPGTPQVSATPLPAGVDSQLTTLMRGVISDGEGTAHTDPPVFPYNLGLAAKTGSAENGGTGKTDSWMIVFDKQHDIAFGAMVVNGGFGIQAAGPAISKALSDLGYE